MIPLTPQDLIPYAEYELGRQAFRQRIIALKKRRRVALGEFITLVFENRETILFQIQEMIRTERIFDPQKVQEELDVYNALLPGPHELSATLFIEITDNDRMIELLNSFQHIDAPETLSLHIGPHITYGEFEGGHSKEDKISAVHFVRFPMPPELITLLADKREPASLHIRHPRHQAETPVSDTLRNEWLTDLQFAPP